MPAAFTESVVEEAALAWFGELGYEVRFGPEIAHDGANPERVDYREVVLAGRLHDALERLNPAASGEAREEALRRVTRVGSPSLVQANRAFHDLLVNGVAVEVLRDGETRGELVQVVDFADPAKNDWLAVNQFTVVEGLAGGQIERRPDVVLFVNGLPLGVVELKNMADEGATIDHAYNQLQTYMAQIPRLFHFNEVSSSRMGRRRRLGA